MDGDTSELTKVEEITPTELRRRFPNMKSEERATVIQNIGLEKALAALRGNDGTQS